jgi:hypothetical protein
MATKAEIKEGQIYYSKSESARFAFRRVLAVVQSRVVYCTGGDKHYACSLQQFIKATKQTAN